jgi:O-antigen ligase
VLGLGPAKVFYTGVFTDSEYLDVLKEFGVVGLLAYLGYYVFPLTLLWKGLRQSRHLEVSFVAQTPAQALTLRFAFVAGTTALLMNVGESTFYNQLLQAFLWLWLGLGVNSLRSVPKAQIVFSRLDSENPD